MAIDAILIFAAALVIASGSPGPSIAALVSHVLQSGWKSVLPFLAAMWIGEALWLAAAIFGLATLAETFHFAFLAIKYVGLIYLLYLAHRMWFAPVKYEDEKLPGPKNAWKSFASGMAITLGNPKIMIFYLALLPSLISVSEVGISQWLILTLTMLVVLAGVDLIWVAMASVARSFLKSPRAMRATNKISASMMTGAAMVIAIRD